MSRIKRLPGVPYTGLRRYFLTSCTYSRRQAFAAAVTADETLAHIRRAARDEAFAILAYCLMPDHMHLVVEATTDRSNLPRFVKLAKQRSRAAYARRSGGRLWQEGYYDRILRADEETKRAMRYVLENPVRASLVGHPEEYPYAGSDRWTVAELLESL